MPVEFEKMKAQRHSAPMKKASEEALGGSIWESPYRLYSRLCGLFSLFAQHGRLARTSASAIGGSTALPQRATNLSFPSFTLLNSLPMTHQP